MTLEEYRLMYSMFFGPYPFVPYDSLEHQNNLLWDMSRYPVLRSSGSLNFSMYPIRVADVEVFVGGDRLIEEILVLSVGTFDMDLYDSRLRIGVGEGGRIEAFIPLVDDDHLDKSSVEMFVDDLGTVKSFSLYKEM